MICFPISGFQYVTEHLIAVSSSSSAPPSSTVSSDIEDLLESYYLRSLLLTKVFLDLQSFHPHYTTLRVNQQLFLHCSIFEHQQDQDVPGTGSGIESSRLLAGVNLTLRLLQLREKKMISINTLLMLRHPAIVLDCHFWSTCRVDCRLQSVSVETRETVKLKLPTPTTKTVQTVPVEIYGIFYSQGVRLQNHLKICHKL